jgi:hypothetical protein
LQVYRYNLRRAFFLISEFRILVYVAPTCYKFLLHISSALSDLGLPGGLLRHDTRVDRHEHNNGYHYRTNATGCSLNNLLHQDDTEVYEFH